MTINRSNFLLSAAGVSVASGLALEPSYSYAQSSRAPTLVVAASGTPEGFDGDALRANTQEVVIQIYENLTRYGRKTVNGRLQLDPTVIEGHLAESWTISPDGKTVVFKLRRGVKSPFGNELTAADVEWSYGKSFAQKRSGLFFSRVSNITAVKAIDKYEVEFQLSAPSGILLNMLTIYSPAIYDTTEVKKHVTPEDPWALKWIESNTAGFGAYHLESLRAGEQAVFVSNPNYFREKPFFTRVIYRAVPSAANRITLLKSRQVHWIARPTIHQVKELEGDRNVKIEGAPGRSMASVRMNVGFKPFDDVRVRKAFNYAIDKELMRKAVFLDTGEYAKSFVPPVVDGFDPSFFNYNHDPAKAKALLAEAGYANGLEVELLYAPESWWEEALTIHLADQMKSVGVTVKPTKITVADLRARAAPSKLDMPFFCFQEGPITLDPLYTMLAFARSDSVGNRARYKNSKMDEIIDEARYTQDAARRRQLVSEAQKLWVDEAPWIMTIFPTTFEAMAPNIVGWVPDYHPRWSDLRFG